MARPGSRGMIKLAQRYKWWLFAIIILGGLVTFIERWRVFREHSQDKVILAAGARYGVDPALIKAVVWRESWFNPRARGGSGEIGLMQIREAAAKDWATAEKIGFFTRHHLYDPANNTLCGTWYLKRLLLRYQDSDNSLPYALAAYNAGPSHVARWRKGAATTNSAEFLQQMDFPSTRRYVRSVTSRYEYYRKTFPPLAAK
jgi:soluble lytic murein transglycosylase